VGYCYNSEEETVPLNPHLPTCPTATVIANNYHKILLKVSLDKNYHNICTENFNKRVLYLFI